MAFPLVTFPMDFRMRLFNSLFENFSHIISMLSCLACSFAELLAGFLANLFCRFLQASSDIIRCIVDTGTTFCKVVTKVCWLYNPSIP